MKRKVLTTIALLMLATTFTLPLAGQNSRPRKEGKIRYHDGQVVLGTSHLYYIFYGDWAGSNAEQALTDFALSLGGSAYMNINTTYYDATLTHVSNSLQWGRNVNDPYSRGTNLSDADIEAIVNSAILSGRFHWIRTGSILWLLHPTLMLRDCAPTTVSFTISHL